MVSSLRQEIYVLANRKGGAVIFQNFDINYIKTVLSGYDKKLQEIEERLLELNHMQCDTDDMIRSLSVKADDFTGTSVRMHDVSSLLLRRRQLMEEQKKEIQCEMWRLMEEEETIWLPASQILKTAKKFAACPEEVSIPEVPPSRAVILAAT